MKLNCSLIILASFFFFDGLKAQAPIKIGCISIQELVTAMPEYKKAVIDLDEYQKALIQQGQDNQSEFMKQDSIFKSDSASWNDDKKEIKRRELKNISMKMISFSRDAQQLMANKEQELVAPIQQKALQTTKEVAIEYGYSYVLSKEQLIAFPVADDILPLALKKLNISLPAKE